MFEETEETVLKMHIRAVVRDVKTIGYWVGGILALIAAASALTWGSIAAFEFGAGLTAGTYSHLAMSIGFLSMMILWIVSGIVGRIAFRAYCWHYYQLGQQDREAGNRRHFPATSWREAYYFDGRFQRPFKFGWGD